MTSIISSRTARCWAVDQQAQGGYNTHTMHTRLAPIVAVLTLFLVLCTLTFVSAQDAQSSETESFALQHMMKPGETVKYKIVQQISGTRALPGVAKPTAIDCELTSVIRVKCVKELSDQGLELAADTESITVKMANRSPRSMPAPKGSRVYRIDRYGKAMDVKDSKSAPPPATRSVLDTAWIECLAIVAAFPETGVNTGSAWSLEMANPLLTDTKIKLSAKLENLKETKDGWVATIKETVGLPDGQTAEIDPEEPGGRIDGTMELKYLADKGRMFSAQGTLKADVRSNMTMPGLPNSDLPMGSVMALRIEQFSCKFKVETIPPGQVSKPSGQ